MKFFVSFTGGMTFLLGMTLAYWSFDAYGIVSCDKTQYGYRCYDNETGEWTDIIESDESDSSYDIPNNSYDIDDPSENNEKK
jgi:hypothetical protein